jgi:cullin-associated NEDD8-dissociated protein 1
LYPSSEANCGGVCQVRGNTCVCNDVAVKSNAVFSQLPTPQDLDKLHIGASDPRLSSDGKYHLCTAPLCSEKGYKVYFSSLNVSEDTDIPGAMNEETVFEQLTESGSTIFLLNMDSTVEISTSYSFRNPPMYNSPVDPTQRDGLYETDAVLQHHVNHPNTAPFISTTLINFFITSNPSPRYVQVVSDAFSKGVYVADGQSFGSGRYGVSHCDNSAIPVD